MRNSCKKNSKLNKKKKVENTLWLIWLFLNNQIKIATERTHIKSKINYNVATHNQHRISV